MTQTAHADCAPAIDAPTLARQQTTRTYWQLFAAVADFARDTGDRPAGIQIEFDLTCDLRRHGFIDLTPGTVQSLFGLPITPRPAGTLGADRYRLQNTADIHKLENAQ